MCNHVVLFLIVGLIHHSFSSSPISIREYYSIGFFREISALATESDEHPSIVEDGGCPSIHALVAIAVELTEPKNVILISQFLEAAVSICPRDRESWFNLGQLLLERNEVENAISKLSVAEALGDESANQAIIYACAFVCDWRMFETRVARLEWQVMHTTSAWSGYQNIRAGHTPPLSQSLLTEHWPHDDQSTRALEFTDVPGYVYVALSHRCASSQNSPLSQAMHQVTTAVAFSLSTPLRIGFLSADFGSHTMSPLLYSLIAALVHIHEAWMVVGRVEIFCFSLSPITSPVWKERWQNVMSTDYFIDLSSPSLSVYDKARLVATRGIHILLDLNGHSQHTGLPVMSLRPAPLQLTYLGYPTTTGAAFVDYILSDAVATPPEHADHFSERLLLMPPSYLVSHHALMMKEHVSRSTKIKAVPVIVGAEGDTHCRPDCGYSCRFSYLASSGSSKFSPEVFQVWMNILLRTSTANSQLVLSRHKDMHLAFPSLLRYSLSLGVGPGRLCQDIRYSDDTHLSAKASYDMYLDTVSKNGHVTTMDAMWAGLPVVSLGGGSRMMSRATQSATSAGTSDRGDRNSLDVSLGLGLAYSLKEYEDMGVRPVCCMGGRDRVERSPTARAWRQSVRRQRLDNGVFNTTLYGLRFTSSILAIWEINGSIEVKRMKKFHVYCCF